MGEIKCVWRVLEALYLFARAEGRDWSDKRLRGADAVCVRLLAKQMDVMDCTQANKQNGNLCKNKN